MGQFPGQHRHPFLDGGDGQSLADDPGGSHQHLLRREGQGLGCRLAHGQGVFIFQGGAGIGVAAVDSHGLGRAAFYMVLAETHRGGLHLVAGKDAGSGAGFFRIDQGQILFVAGICFDAHMDAGSGKALGGTYAAGNEMYHGQLLCFKRGDGGSDETLGFRERQHQVHILHRCTGGTLAQIVKQGGDGKAFPASPHHQMQPVGAGELVCI